MKFLIATEPDDTHSLFVKVALESLDHEVRLLFLADHPTKLKNTIYLDNNDYFWKSSDNYDSFIDNDYDVVWWRRVRKPFLPKKAVHLDDYDFVLKENVSFCESLSYNLAPHALWINKKEAAIRANSKLLQLRTAKECGMLIPPTLCSNNPKDIHYFLLKNEEDSIIYKPFCPNFWYEDEFTKIPYTAQVRFLDLPRNKLLQFSPGIYQKEIEKRFELRIICFADYIVAARLNSQNHPKGRIDWRAIPDKELSIEPYLLPLELKNQLKMFMNKLGIIFGSFDYIVTPEGNYIFLEINEQGQFLWLEEYNPEFKMLDIFINFLLNKADNFNWEPRYYAHSIEQYRPTIEHLYIQNKERHVSLNQLNQLRA